MGVLAIWRYPVKAMLGELLDRARVRSGGIEGDRRWVVRDARTGDPIASKRGPTDPRLRECRAEIDGEGRLTVAAPGGAGMARGATAAAELLSDLLGRPVTLDEHPGSGRGFLRTSGHHDLAPLHVLTTGSLNHMRRMAPGSDWDPRRFRPNLLLDDGLPGDALSETRLLGTELRSGSGAALAVGLPTPRCVVTTRAREELPRDTGLLRRIAQVSRWDLGPFGRPACLGTYAEVVSEGTVEVGERLAVVKRLPAEEAVSASVERIASTGERGA